jgi:hypothetical protein
MSVRLRFASTVVCFASLRSADISKGRARRASLVLMLTFGDVLMRGGSGRLSGLVLAAALAASSATAQPAPTLAAGVDAVELYLVDAPPAAARAMDIVVAALSAQRGRPVKPVRADASAFASSRASLRLVATTSLAKIPGLVVALPLDEAMRIRNRQSRRELLRVTPEGSLVALELAAGPPPTLVLQWGRGADATTLESFALRATERGRFPDFVGAVVIGDGADVVMLRFGPGGVDARPERLTAWERYFVEHRPWWFLFASALIVGALVVTWKRLGRRPLVSPPPVAAPTVQGVRS